MDFAPWLVRISDDTLKLDLAEARGVWRNRADCGWFGCYRLLLCGCIFYGCCSFGHRIGIGFWL